RRRGRRRPAEQASRDEVPTQHDCRDEEGHKPDSENAAVEVTKQQTQTLENRGELGCNRDELDSYLRFAPSRPTDAKRGGQQQPHDAKLPRLRHKDGMDEKILLSVYKKAIHRNQHAHRSRNVDQKNDNCRDRTPNPPLVFPDEPALPLIVPPSEETENRGSDEPCREIDQRHAKPIPLERLRCEHS